MRPIKNDYAPYYETYISKVKGDCIIQILSKMNQEIQTVCNSFAQHKGDYKYAEGKWTVKELIGHVMDTERVFAFRAFSIARGEKQHLPGFEQDNYVREGKFNQRQLSEIVYEFRLLRESYLLLFRSFDDEMLKRRGIANGCEVTVNALLFIIVGHSKHHIDILRERYL